MKKIYIERLMEGIKIPIDIINETIENNMHFPILKMKQKTILDNNSNEENQITDFICSKCSHKFTVIGKVTGYQECPSCKNRDSYFISKTISEITAEFKFSQTLSVNFTKDNDETIGTYKSRFYYNEYKGNRTLDTSEILIK